MIRLNLSFQNTYSKTRAIFRVVLFPILGLIALIYLLLILSIFYILCFAGLVQTIITKQYPDYASKWALYTGQSILRIQMFFIGLNDNYPSLKFGFSDTDLIRLEVDKQTEYSRLLSITYLIMGWMLIIPQLIWFLLYSFFIFCFAIFSFIELCLKGEYNMFFLNYYIYYARFTARLFVYFTGLRQEYPTFDLSNVDY